MAKFRNIVLILQVYYIFTLMNMFEYLKAVIKHKLK